MKPYLIAVLLFAVGYIAGKSQQQTNPNYVNVEMAVATIGTNRVLVVRNIDTPTEWHPVYKNPITEQIIGVMK